MSIEKMIKNFTEKLKNNSRFRFICFTGKPELQFRDGLAYYLKKHNYPYISKETNLNGKKKDRADLVLYKQDKNELLEKLAIEVKAGCLFNVIKKSKNMWDKKRWLGTERGVLEGQLGRWKVPSIGIFLIIYLKPLSDCKPVKEQLNKVVQYLNNYPKRFDYNNFKTGRLKDAMKPYRLLNEVNLGLETIVLSKKDYKFGLTLFVFVK